MTTDKPHDKAHFATFYTRNVSGCYADGTFSHQHCREVLADLVKNCDPELSESLEGDMPDDAWDEDAALDILNEHTAEGLVWRFYDGDLVLMEVEEE